MTSSIAGVLDNILATLLVSIYNFLYKPDGMIDIFSQYNDIINNILEKPNNRDRYKACRQNNGYLPHL